MNSVLRAMNKGGATTWNGAISNATSGSQVLDYFAKCGSYRGRTQSEVNASLASIFGEDAGLAMKTVFYNRMITRKCKGFVDQTESVQKGQGQKDEFIKSLIWLENNYPDILYTNLWLIPEVGCWKDLWYDSASTGLFHYTNTEKVYPLVEEGMQDEYHCHLVAKFLPKIRSRRNTKTDRHKRLNSWARGLCKHLGWTERQYRKFKSDPSNKAHSFQRLMCTGRWNDLNFKAIPGRALFSLTSQKGKDGRNAIERHGLEDKYVSWIKEQPTAKFKGYPYELFMKAKGNRSVLQKYTYDKQFEGLLELAREGSSEALQKGVLCAIDTSGSMGALGHYGWGSPQSSPQPIDVCVGLGIYFSALLEGHFKNHVMMFNNTSRLKKLSGGFCDRVDQIKNSATAWGGTNFQSVIDELVRVRKGNPNIPVEDFPEMLLVVSDMQFNPSGGYGHYSESQMETNYETAMRKLNAVGLPNMSIVWWNVNGRFSEDVPSTMFDEGTTLISGFDGSIVTTLLGNDTVVDEKTGEKRKANPYEQMLGALDQEILNCVQI